MADAQLAGAPSVVFDAVALVLSADGATELANDWTLLQWIKDAYAHFKPIGFAEEARGLLEAAGISAGPGVVTLAGFPAAAGKRYFERASAAVPPKQPRARRDS